MSKEQKTWKEYPSKTEITETIKLFFDLLKKGDVESAKNLVSHEYDDWEETLSMLWEDTYLTYESAKGSTYQNYAWLKDLDMVEDGINWYEITEKRKNLNVMVDLQYRDEPTGHAATFVVEKNSDGDYILSREGISM